MTFEIVLSRVQLGRDCTIRYVLSPPYTNFSLYFCPSGRATAPPIAHGFVGSNLSLESTLYVARGGYGNFNIGRFASSTKDPCGFACATNWRQQYEPRPQWRGSSASHKAAASAGRFVVAFAELSAACRSWRHRSRLFAPASSPCRHEACHCRSFCPSLPHDGLHGPRAHPGCRY